MVLVQQQLQQGQQHDQQINLRSTSQLQFLAAIEKHHQWNSTTKIHQKTHQRRLLNVQICQQDFQCQSHASSPIDKVALFLVGTIGECMGKG